MKTRECALCGIKRRAGSLHIVKLNSTQVKLVCMWCTGSIVRVLRDEDKGPRKDLESVFTSNTFINEEQMKPHLRIGELERLKGEGK